MTTTTGFLTGDAIPGTVVTEAGVFLLTGDERGGDAEFVADANYVTALQALGRRIYAREMLACGMFQVPLDYTVQTLKCWSNAKIAVVAGMYLLGITQDEIATALVDNPSASPMDVIAARMPSD